MRRLGVQRVGGRIGGATLQLIVFVSNDVRCGGNQGLQDEGDSGDFERSDDGGVVGDWVNHDVHLLGQIEDIESNMVSEQAALSGRIRLATPMVFGRCHLGSAINDFITLHPQIEFDIEFNDRHIDIIDEGFDLAVRIAKLDDSRMIARRLARVTASVAASPEYWHRNGNPRRVQDLSNHRALHYSYRLTSTWRYVEPRGRKGSVRVPGALQANNVDYIVDAAIVGLSVILQPKFIAHEAINAGLLVPVFPTYQWIHVEAYAVYPKTRSLPSRVRTFIDFLSQRWGDCSYWESY